MCVCVYICIYTPAGETDAYCDSLGEQEALVCYANNETTPIVVSPSTYDENGCD